MRMSERDAIQPEPHQPLGPQQTDALVVTLPRAHWFGKAWTWVEPTIHAQGSAQSSSKAPFKPASRMRLSMQLKRPLTRRVVRVAVD